MEKEVAFKAMASVGSTQALMRVVSADVRSVWEAAPTDSPLEILGAIAKNLCDALVTTLDGMREQTEIEYDNAEVSGG